ncbi:hypothetical protein TRVL_07581 [Trypanosoma vivax]|nr:hypothetical protein TRVL_07581 [Trypanosoma vivax]
MRGHRGLSSTRQTGCGGETTAVLVTGCALWGVEENGRRAGRKTDALHKREGLPAGNQDARRLRCVGTKKAWVRGPAGHRTWTEKSEATRPQEKANWKKKLSNAEQV